MYELETAKFMYILHYHKLPKNLYNSFQKLTYIHEYQTRLVNSTLFFLPRVNEILDKTNYATEIQDYGTH